MAPNEYTNALQKALSDLTDRVQRRDLLTAEIAGLKETVRVLVNRVEIPRDQQSRIAQIMAMADSATPKVTDAIRALLIRVHPLALTAVEVRDALEDSSSFDDSSNSLSACHAALKRMLADDEVELAPAKDGKATYRYVLMSIAAAPLGGLSKYLSAARIREDGKVPPPPTMADIKRK